MKSMNSFATAIVLLCLFVSCNNFKEKNAAEDKALPEIQKGEEKNPEPPIPQQQLTDTAQTRRNNSHQIKSVTAQSKPDWDKKIIKTASLNAEVKDYSSYYSTLREKVKSIGGYVAQEDQNQSEYKIENSITIKVPVDQFDEALNLLANGTVKINERKISSQDVTTEIIDTKSRMEAKRQVRERYIDLLKQAKNMQEILNVQSEINGVQEEIESATGRISYLSHASVFSTIHFTFFQVLNIEAKDLQEPSFWTKIGHSFREGWEWTGNLIIGLVTIWPVILFFAMVWVIIRKYTKTKPKAVSTTQASS